MVTKLLIRSPSGYKIVFKHFNPELRSGGFLENVAVFAMLKLGKHIHNLFDDDFNS